MTPDLRSILGVLSLLVAGGHVQAQDATGPQPAAAVYDVRIAEGDGRWTAANEAQGFQATIDAQGMTIAALGAEASGPLVSMRLVAWGRAGQLADPGAAQAAAAGPRLEYQRAALAEWFVNGAVGLEHGFTIPSAPAGRASDPLELHIALGGALRAHLLPDASGLLLADEQGVARLSYTRLAAWDAGGRPLAARLELTDGGFAIVVDDAGAAFPITVDPMLATEEAKLTANDPPALFLGLSVALSGDTAIAGALAEDPAGSAYVFLRSGTSWSQQAKLTASDAEPGDAFGRGVSLSSETAIVGANDDDMGPFAGSAYVFVRSGTSWGQQAKLYASDAAAGDEFGWASALSGETAVVAARDKGAAYVFIRSGTTWSEQAKLTADDAVKIGDSVALSGDTAVVGAEFSDAAYVFVRSGTSWSQQAKLTASDGGFGDRFGSAVAVEGDTIVVGASHDDEPAWVPDSGSAYVFVRSGTSWTQQAKLTAYDPLDALSSDHFGVAVSLSGDRAAIGAEFGPSFASSNAGATYVFVRDGTSWSQQVTLVASDGANADEFGKTVSIEGDRVLVGAYANDTAYVYRLTVNGTPWTNLGFGLGGVTLPRLDATGTLAAGSAGSLVLTNTPTFMPSILFVSFVGVGAPFKGGTLVPVPFALMVSLSTGSLGKITVGWSSFPGGVPPGTNLYFQYAIQDGFAVAGVALSNAVRGTTP